MTAPYRTAVSGERLAGRYELGTHIDSGGMAEVWEATDHTLGRTVAVKILHAHLARDAAFLRRFRREAINAARLQHPTIVAIYDAVSYDGLEAIVMERIEGRTLRSVLDEHPRLPARDVIDLGRQIAQALSVAHAAGVIHRDIKPSNIMLCEDRRIRVTDFGIAKAGEDTDLTRTGSLLGTAKYLSPEQVLGDEVDDRSDLYGLGVVLFEALAGTPPFDEGNDYATAQARVVNPAPRLSQFRPDLPASLDALVARLLEQDPADRPDSALELSGLLSSITIVSEEFGSGAPKGDLTTIDLRHGTNGDADSTGEITPEPKRRSLGRKPTPAATPDATVLARLEAPPLGTADLEYVGLPPDDGDGEPVDRDFSLPIGKLLLLGIVLGTLGLVAALLNGYRSDPGDAGVANPGGATDGLDGESVSLTPVQDFGPPIIATGQAVDPLGDNTENDDMAGNAIDGDPSTAWVTETYSKPGFSSVKDGVGYLITLTDPSAPTELRITTPTAGWRAEVYVGDSEAESPEGFTFGPYAIEPKDDGGVADLRNASGSHVLIWITFEGQTSPPNPEGEDPPPELENRFELAEVVIE